MEEVEHVIWVLEQTNEALLEEDSEKLKELSNQTIHSASYYQDRGSIALAVLVYSLGKLIERKDYSKIRAWNSFKKKFTSWFSLAIKSLKQKKFEAYEKYLAQSRKALENTSINIKPYIEEVLRKASINKASRIYEHGISLGKTAQLLGITQWELTEYTGQKKEDSSYGALSAKKRAQMALEFFS